MIDLIRDGVPANVLRARGGRAVYASLWRTAASACQRGLDQWEWEEYVFEPQSQLGRQARMRDGRTVLPADRHRRMLDRVWNQATAWVSAQDPPATRQELFLRARTSLTAARRKLEDPDAPLSASDRLVLAYACSEIERRGMERVALPWRSVCEATGLQERMVKNSLRRLVDGRHLLLATAGKPGSVGARRANVYRPRPTCTRGRVYGTSGAGLWDPLADRGWDPLNGGCRLAGLGAWRSLVIGTPSLPSHASDEVPDAEIFPHCLVLPGPEGPVRIPWTEECILWLQNVGTDKYGKITDRSMSPRVLRADRWVWLMDQRSIGPGLALDHLCGNRFCVNPRHLEPVTPAEKKRRARAAPMWWS